MKTLESDQLINKILKLEASEDIQFGERSLPVDTGVVVELTDKHQNQISEAIFNGLSAFGALEKTLAMSVVGLPTAIARADCTIDTETGMVHVYEVEERPAGMGVSDILSRQVTGREFATQIREHLENTFQTLPVVKRHPLALENDDALILSVETLSNKRLASNGRPLLIRAEPADMTAHPDLSEATSLAIAPIQEKGKRQYRITTGMATLVTSPDVLPDGSLVIKSLQGSKAKGVCIHLTKTDSRLLGNNRDSVSRTKLKNMIEAEGAVIAESFVAGIPVEMVGGTIGRMILRVFALVNPNDVRVIGGAFMARPGHLVHGSNDAVSGVVLANGRGLQ